MIREKNAPRLAAELFAAAALSLLSAVACQRESAAPPDPSHPPHPPITAGLSAPLNAPGTARARPRAVEPAPPLDQASGTAGTVGNIGAVGASGASGSGASGSIPGEPVTSELHREPQNVRVGDAAPSAPAPSGAERDLAARERRLAARVAALEARERQLRRKDEAPSAPAIDSASAADSSGAVAPSDQSAAAAGEAAPLDAAAPMPSGTPAPGAAGVESGDGNPIPGGGSGAGSVEPPPWPANEAAQAGPVTVPAGTSFEVEFTKGLASNTSSVGQTFRARLLSDLRLEGTTAIPAGAEILGVVTEAVAARRIGGKAKLSLKITDLVLPSGSTLPIHASFLEEAKSKTGRDAATIGGAAAGGGLLGRILGQSGKSTILGALVGAAVGTAIASRTAGEEVVIPEGSVVKLKLDEALAIKSRH
jgi:hypothetical protein